MKEDTPIPVLLLFGPTASGKTEVLESLFAGEGALFPAEIVSADSMQVYRGMDIGTAKPDLDLRSRLPHHLIDIRDPDEQFSVGDFVRLADEACRDIASRGLLPVISGGTAFYLKNFMLGLSAAPPSDPLVRDALKEELMDRGAAALAQELASVDPVSARRIHAHDVYRILRALEVFRVSGFPLSTFPVSGNSSEGRPLYRFLAIGIDRERGELYRRIDQRAHVMFLKGLPAEVEGLLSAGYGREDPALRAIGYREFFGEDGSFSHDFEAIETLVARNSRHYAKRQITFFASLPGVHWVRGDEGGVSLSRVVEAELSAFLKNDPSDFRDAGP
jgi:tRNA dimethylallyltransferase